MPSPNSGGDYDLSVYIDGCLWNIPTWQQVEWVQEVVLPSCSNVVLDMTTDRYQPKLWVKPVASPLVQQTIEATEEKLATIMWVAVALTLVGFLLLLLFLLCSRQKPATGTAQLV